MDLKRWLTGLLLAPIVVGALLVGHNGAIFVLLCLVAILCLIEFFKITFSTLSLALRVLWYFLTIGLFWLLYSGEIHLFLFVVALWFFLPALFVILFDPQPSSRKVEALAIGALGLIYICVPLVMLGLIVRHPAGNIWLLFLLVVVFSGDTGAFYMGRWVGKRRLHPTISPAKTWEGAVGGLVSSLIAGAWFIHLTGLDTLNPLTFFLIILLSIVAQLGDLSESFIKRSFQIKDSGRLLPGHGGFLDRIDGVLFASPVLYLHLAIKTLGVV